MEQTSSGLTVAGRFAVMKGLPFDSVEETVKMASVKLLLNKLNRLWANIYILSLYLSLSISIADEKRSDIYY